MRPLVLLTDFGLCDHYAGVLHGVLAREAPGAERIDLGHQVDPGDVWMACHLLRSAWTHLPERAVVLAVVDPGVGTARQAVAAAIGERWLVAPDNGLLTSVGPVGGAVGLDVERMGLARPSPTFHGRDLFAPAAARLARGEEGPSLGPAVDPSRLAPCPLPEPERLERGWRAAVVHVDRFGNLVTNLRRSELEPTRSPRCSRFEIEGWVETYGEAEPGAVVLLTGSSGQLEVSMRDASAAEHLGVVRGDILELEV